MEQHLRSITTFEELDELITAHTFPEDLIPLALERLVDLTANALEVHLVFLFRLWRFHFALQTIPCKNWKQTRADRIDVRLGKGTWGNNLDVTYYITFDFTIYLKLIMTFFYFVFWALIQEELFEICPELEAEIFGLTQRKCKCSSWYWCIKNERGKR